MPLIGFSGSVKCLRLLTVCLQGLNETGYIEGQSVGSNDSPSIMADALIRRSAATRVTSGFTVAPKAVTMSHNVERVAYVV